MAVNNPCSCLPLWPEPFFIHLSSSAGTTHLGLSQQQGAPGCQALALLPKGTHKKKRSIFPLKKQVKNHSLLSVEDDKVLLDSFKAFLEIIIFLLRKNNTKAQAAAEAAPFASAGCLQPPALQLCRSPQPNSWSQQGWLP